jgi:uncharacterized oxidoreductase
MALTKKLKATPPAQGYDEVLVAGEPELRHEAKRKREGIPLAEATWESLVEWGAKLGIAAPATI